MSSNSLSVSLAELEDNLKNIDSTQKQVKNLISSMDDLARSYQETLTKVDKVGTALGNDNDTYKENFSKTTKQLGVDLAEFEKQLKENSNKINKSFDQMIKSQNEAFNINKTSWNKHTDEFTTYIHNFRNHMNKETKDIVQIARIQFENLNSVFLKQCEFLEKNIKDKIDELNKLEVITRIDQMESDISKILTKLEDSHLKFNTINNEIFAFKSSNESKLSKLTKVMNTKSTLNLLIMVLGFIVVLLGMYLFR